MFVKNKLKMAFLFQSMRSFKVRITLIFFSLIVLAIILFIGFFQIEKQNNYLLNDIKVIEQLTEGFFTSTLNLQSAFIYGDSTPEGSQDFKKALQSYHSDLTTYKAELESLKDNLGSHDIVFGNDFDSLFKELGWIEKTVTDNSVKPSTVQISFKEFESAIQRLTSNLKSLKSKLVDTLNNKNSSLKKNALVFFIMLGILFIGIIYYLAHRLTRDLRNLNLKIDKLKDTENNFREEPLVSNIEEVNSLDKRFESIKATMRELKSDLEEATKVSEYKSVFLANMSYEIRTPLNSVLGMINMLKQSHLTTEQQIQLEIAEYSSEHVLQLANMILDNSKVEGGNIELELTAIDLKSDLSKLVKVFEYEAWDNDLEFEFKLLADDSQKFLLLGDLKRIKQILTNLLSNAIKFTNSGKVSLIIDQSVGPDDFQIVTFYVKDTGIGISPEKAKRILKDSKNNHLSIMDYYGGTGLGLTASCQLIELMGGELKLESKENEGSIFYFSIQLQKTLNLEREKQEPAPVLLNKFDYKFSVLVAEDNTMNQKVIKFLLEQQGADCTFVKNGSDAVKLYNILDFDMVFMDIFMPEMDGYEATRIIKKSPKYAEHNIPIIAVSASAFQEDIKNAKDAGIDDFLAKPIEIKRLKELLDKYAPENSAIDESSEAK